MALFPARPHERRHAFLAFATLFGLIGSHAILETARDALFLARVPIRHLPWVSLAVAALAFLVVRVQARLAAGRSPRRALAFATALAAIVTFGFSRQLEPLGDAGVYALYIWSGSLTTLLLVWFWTLLGGLFSVAQAKRLYGFIGAGSVLGAIVGSGLAGVFARTVSPARLLVVSAAGFALTSTLPLLFRASAHDDRHVASVSSGVDEDADANGGAASAGFGDTLRRVRGSVYARRLLAVLFLSTVCLSLADYVFKSQVAALVPKAELGAFLGTLSFVVNIVSLIVQLALVGRLLGRFSVGASIAILPALLFVSGLSVAATGTLLAVVLCRGVDGALRYSLHRTAAELLYFPFSGDTRHRLKGLLDVIGLRGGQIVASLGLLALTLSPGVSARGIAVVLAIVALAWAIAALRLRAPYVALFRERLAQGRLVRLDAFPELDVASLETLVATLDSDRDELVLAALHVLERERKAHLVPALILYHPSEAVMAEALALFTRSQRTNVVPVLDRVLDHASPHVRALAIAARSALAHDRAMLLARLDAETSDEVRAAVVVQLVAAGDLVGEEARARLTAVDRGGSARTKIALAEAIARRGAGGFDEVLLAFAQDESREVRGAAIVAMGKLVREAFVAPLIAAIAEEATRQRALSALAAHGDRALAGLRCALEAPDDGSLLRWRIPHAISFLEPPAAAEVLVGWLAREPEGSVRFQMIRALERLARRSPDLVLDRRALLEAAEQAVRRAFASLDARVALDQSAVSPEGEAKAARELLSTTLAHKEKNAIDRLFRLLGLAFVGEDFQQIHRGLRGTIEQRAVSHELIESLLDEPLRSAVRGLVDDVPDEERLRRAGGYHTPMRLRGDALLVHLGTTDSEALRDIAGFYREETRREETRREETRRLAAAPSTTEDEGRS